MSDPTILTIHHVALTVPTGQLEEARRFYTNLLGLEEIPRPDAELGRPGIWYRLRETELHIQCRDDAAPESSDRHPALVVDGLFALKERLQASDADVSEARAILGRERFFARDPFGNRIEFMTLPS